MKFIMPHPLTPEPSETLYQYSKDRRGYEITRPTGLIGNTMGLTTHSDIPKLICRAIGMIVFRGDNEVIEPATPFYACDTPQWRTRYELENRDVVLAQNGMELFVSPRVPSVFDDRRELLLIGRRTFEEEVTQTTVRSIEEAWEALGEGYRQWATHYAIPAELATMLAVTQHPELFHAPRAPVNTHRALLPELKDLEDTELPAHLKILMACAGARFNPDDKTLSLFLNFEDRRRDRRTTMKVGKALRRLGFSQDDETIKNVASEITGALTPPEFHIGWTKEDFDHAYTNGPSSCMTYDNLRYHAVNNAVEQGVEDAGQMRPTDALINGDIGVAVMKAGDKVTARALVVHSRSAYVRLYNADFSTSANGHRVLERHLEEAGYHQNKNALDNQRLLKIEIPNWQNNSVLDDMFRMTNMYLTERILSMTKYRRAGARTDEMLETVRELANQRCFLMPYLDWNNRVVKDEGDALRVLPENEYPEPVDHAPASIINAAKHLPEKHRINGVGRCHYQSGACVTVDAAAIMDWVDANREEQPAPESTPAARDNETVADLIRRQIAEQNEPTPQPTAPQQETSDNYHQRRLNVIIEETPNNDAANELRPILFPNSDALSFEVTEAQAEQFFNCDVIPIRLTDGPFSGQHVWAAADEVIGTECGMDYIEGREEHFDIIHCDGYGWYETCEVVYDMHNDPTPQDRAYYSENMGEWLDEGVAVWSEAEDSYLHEDDVVVDMNGQFIRYVDAYRLPNGQFIHEDDLERA